MLKLSGRTAHEDLKLSRHDSPMLAFGENALARRSGVPDNRLSSALSLGVWLGRATETNEHIVGAAVGVLRTRTAKRRPEELQWEKWPLEAMVYPHWLPSWTPTAGCQACEDDQAAV